MFECFDGAKLPSVVMIDQEMYTLEVFREVFHRFLPRIKFFTMTYPTYGVYTAALYEADLIVLEIYYSKFGFYDGEKLIEALRNVRPEAEFLIYSVQSDEDIIFKYREVFGVEAYMTKSESLEKVVRKICSMVGEPCYI